MNLAKIGQRFDSPPEGSVSKKGLEIERGIPNNLGPVKSKFGKSCVNEPCQNWAENRQSPRGEFLQKKSLKNVQKGNTAYSTKLYQRII